MRTFIRAHRGMVKEEAALLFDGCYCLHLNNDDLKIAEKVTEAQWCHQQVEQDSAAFRLGSLGRYLERSFGV